MAASAALIVIVSGALVIAALSTGASSCSSWSTWASSSSAASYVVTRFGLADLEAGYVLDRVHAADRRHPACQLHRPQHRAGCPSCGSSCATRSTLPVDLPAQAVSLGPRSEKSWSVRVPLTRRGHFRVEPWSLRTGDPLGMFESQAIGRQRLERDRLSARRGAARAGSCRRRSSRARHASPVRTPHTTPHATGIRPYAPGDPYNRIHWKSTARNNSLQVKEFDLEQTADVWIFLDLQRHVHSRRGRRVDARIRRPPGGVSLAARALLENRNVGMSTSARASSDRCRPIAARASTRRSCRLLAAVGADGTRVRFEHLLAEGMPASRRGMTAVDHHAVARARLGAAAGHPARPRHLGRRLPP